MAHANVSAPLSLIQQALWLQYTIDPGSPAYNTAFYARVLSPIDGALLQRALDAILARHASLSVVFDGSGPQPVQRVVEPRCPLREIDARGWSEDVLLERVREENARPYDLRTEVAVRATVFRRDEDAVLLVGIHHIVHDNLSLALLVEELGLEYAAAQRGVPSDVPVPEKTYFDFVAEEASLVASPAGERHYEYWRRTLGDVVMHLPTDRARPRTGRMRGETHRFDLGPRVTEKVRAAARAHDATRYTVLLAAFQALLARFTRQTDVYVGGPISVRPRGYERCHGDFVNAMVLGADLSGNPTFGEIVAQVRTRVLEAKEHGVYPFYLLSSRLRAEGRTPPRIRTMFQIGRKAESAVHELLFTADRTIRYELGGLQLESYPLNQMEGQFDLAVILFDGEPVIGGTIRYDPDQFDLATIVRLADHYRALLEQVFDDPSLRLSDLAVMSAKEQAALETWNATDVPRTPGETVLDLFAAAVARAPHAPAVTSDHETLTFAELDARSRALAAHLAERGVGSEALCAIALDRSPALLVAILGVLKSGAAYVPVDPSYPADRIRYMLEDANAPVVVTSRAVAERLPGHAATTLLVDELDLARDGRPGRASPHPDALAYVIYTSGSTGRPKGAMITHRGLHNYLAWAVEAYAVGEGNGAPVHSPIGFDLTITSLLAPLLAGRTARMLPDERGPELLARSLREHPGASLVKITPAHLAALAQLVPPAEAAAATRVFVVGGEALGADACRFWRTHAPETRIVNEYGPTETVVGCCVHEVEGELPSDGTIPIGRPIANTRLHVVDADLRPVPPGVPGELCIGGLGVGRGYLGRPELTAERFVPSPFGPPGARLYRTGDLVRMRTDGNLEFIGRIDGQIKLRGYRIELGEIQARVAAHPDIAAASVVLREDVPGTKRLVAYVVARGDAEELASRLRAFVGETLPEYMVPSAFVALPELPLTANGKVDAKALPHPDQARVATKVETTASLTPAEQVLIDICKDLLALDAITPADDFFELGGDSIVCLQLIARAKAAGLLVALRDVFEKKTLGAIARTAKAAKPPAPPAPTPRAKESTDAERLRAELGDGVEDVYELGPVQEGILFHTLLEGTRSGVYYNQLTYVVEGNLDPSALVRAWQLVVDETPILRTSFHWTSLARPLQVVHRQAPLEWHEEDWRDVPGTEQNARLERYLAEDRARGIELARAPLMRMALFRRADDRWTLVWNHHHLLLDGWSVTLVLRDAARNYACLTEGRPRVPREAPPFRVYVDWVRAQDWSGEAAYWRNELQGFQAPTPVGFVTSEEAPAETVPEQIHTLSAELSSAIQDFTKRHRITFNTLMQGMWAILLGRYSGERDVLFGATVSGRPTSLPAVESVVGMFINTLPIRVRVDDRSDVLGWLEELQLHFVSLLEHSTTPLAQIQSWSEIQAGRSLFDSIVVVENFPQDNYFDTQGEARSAGLLRMAGARYVEQTNYPLSIVVLPGREIVFAIAYDARRFSPDAITRLRGHIETLLAGMMADVHGAIGDLPILTPGEREQLLFEWNRTTSPATDARPVHLLVEHVARTTPDALAVSDADGTLTYAELDARAQRMAARLVAVGVGPDVPVALLMQRSRGWVVTMLAVLKAGGAYMPLDPANPDRRLSSMLDHASVVVADAALRPRIERTDIPVLDPAEEGDDPPALAAAPVGEDHLAYVIFTSGSTGGPKAVEVGHRGLSNLVAWHVREYAVTPADRASQVAGPGFDASVWEIWPYLAAGASVHLARDVDRLEPRRLVDWLADRRITLAFLPTPLAEACVDEPIENTSLRALLTGGDRLRRPRRSLPFRFVNHYGPTEYSVVTTFADVAGKGDPPIGRPIANTRVHVLDDRLCPVPVGVEGELFVGGEGLARRYADVALTAQSFVPDPFLPGQRLYRTGDVVRRRADGDLEYVGRRDHQVKIRGQRIELGEVESALRLHPAVRDAVALVRAPAGREARLVAWVVLAEQGVAEDDLREHMRRTVTEAMVPTHVVVVAELPLTTSGKVDRRALPDPAEGVATGFVAPEGDLETTLAAIWKDLLGVPRVGRDDDFFALGGHSLRAIHLVAAIERATGKRPSLSTVLQHRRLRALAESLRASDTGGTRVIELGPTPAAEATPLFCVHPIGGNVLCYAALARALGPRFRTLGLPAPGIEGEGAPLRSTRALAERHADSIAATGLRSFALFGWSFGGLVAVELARVLRERGLEPRRVIVLDSRAPLTSPEPALEHERLVELFVEDLVRGGAGDDGGAREVDHAIRAIREHGTVTGPLLVPFETFAAHHAARAAYTPARIDVPVHLLLTDQSLAARLDAAWRTLVPELRVDEIPGDHWSALAPPHLAALVETMLRILSA